MSSSFCGCHFSKIVFFKRAISKEASSFKSKAKTAIKNYNEAIKTKEDPKVVGEKLSEVCSLMDKGVKRGVYKHNKADRLKSRFTIKAK